MITKITLNTGSIYDGSSNCTFEPSLINLIFGINGAGKTSISRVLRDPNRYKKTIITTDEVSIEDSEILVYNEDFIEENFRSNEGKNKKQKVIFTLGEDNVKLRKRIEYNEKIIKKNEKRLYHCNNAFTKIERDIQEQIDSCIDLIYANRNELSDSPIMNCLKKYYRKKADYARQVLEAIHSSKDDIHQLEQEASFLSADNLAERPLLSTIHQTEPCNPDDPRWTEMLVPLGESSLKALATRLQHDPWIHQGLSYMQEAQEVCPFCQQTISQDIKKNLYALFDDTYQSLRRALVSEKEKYEKFLYELKETLKANEQLSEGQCANASLFRKKADDIKEISERNFNLIRNKATTPGISIHLENLSDALHAYNGEVKEINRGISERNRKLRNLAESKQKLEERYWGYVRAKCEPYIGQYTKLKAHLEAKRRQRRNIEGTISARIEYLKRANADYNKSMTNPLPSLDIINSQLKVLGICDIELRYQEEDKTYSIFRKSTNTHVYKSLSEGEKTIITFLYFLERCKGSYSQDAFVDEGHKIIVVDDPISSLSSNYMYEIAYLLRKNLVKGRGEKLVPLFMQIFILTHNLYFFNEMASNGFYDPKALLPDKRNKTSLWYVSKTNNHSSIRAMKAEEICNDYQAFWHILNDIFEKKIDAHILPNVMRNILEYYYTFIAYQDKLSHALSDLADREDDITIKGLCRYLNRNSHSDPTNVTHNFSIDFERFIVPFGRVFEKTGQMDHFHRMARATTKRLYEKLKKSES